VLWVEEVDGGRRGGFAKWAVLNERAVGIRRLGVGDTSVGGPGSADAGLSGLASKEGVDAARGGNGKRILGGATVAAVWGVAVGTGGGRLGGTIDDSEAMRGGFDVAEATEGTGRFGSAGA